MASRGTSAEAEALPASRGEGSEWFELAMLKGMTEVLMLVQPGQIAEGVDRIVAMGGDLGKLSGSSGRGAAPWLERSEALLAPTATVT